jgi:hypothetical protein
MIGRKLPQAMVLGTQNAIETAISESHRAKNPMLSVKEALVSSTEGRKTERKIYRCCGRIRKQSKGEMNR